jgi:predicted Fe-Mo cluster-binding NifX family protein
MTGERTRVAIACDDDRGLDGEVSPHFGRCRAFTIVDLEGDRVVSERVAVNPHAVNHVEGSTPTFLTELGCDVVLAGGMGPRAIALFHARGIEVATGIEGQARRALESYLVGEERSSDPCDPGHRGSCGGHRG